ncbi:LOW QUALITY PROTEIN: probable LRR receptor-like serine/threonine-protein kinase At4g29180 [Eucalyptus grandis]|uniref:LOW QUALITY PROTEIN: probable LRR receptor-like serine/threonine-protein kinase At4g29180 n=1 Tax=Eucalyptus grandis TaxID=71139 RepID=UPI00192E8FA7|nr:LOW QUALITY PROTEIN: probable LRR receptor-like serine/threonine-protein kinase At4g29180 [Eucalyptus grandis]
MQVSTQVIYQNNLQQSKNLRIFPNGKRNCYTLMPDKGKGNPYLVRASFWYGNYDGKNQTPAFDLHIDVNYWNTVNSSSCISKEIFYTPPRDYIQVCLVNTGSGVPFISALELRLMNNSTYQINSGALSVNDMHPEDVCDRIWNNETYSGGLSSVSNTTAIATSTSNDAYKVPPEVLMSAIQAQNVTDPLSLFWTSNDSTIVWYIYFHFVELQMQKDQFRELTVYVQDTFVKTIMLKNLKPMTIASLPISEHNLSFTINATAHSSLPPLLNAIEFFTTMQLPNSPTFLDDLNAMYDIKKTYGGIRASWQGDPCIPTQYSWNDLNCSSNSSPRIISLNLSSSGLKGLIATSISNLTAVASLDLSNNSLTGSVPDFLAQMPNLKVLNLSGNNLNGSVPQTLLKKTTDGSLLLSLDGNPNLCQSDNCQTSNVQPKKKGISIAPIIASVAAALVLILVGALAVLWIIKRRQIQNVTTTTTATNSTRGESTGTLRLSKNQLFTSTEITRITDNFGTIIGEGGFGKVYLGRLDNGTKVAVKLLSRSSKQGYKEFHAEVQLLMVVHHRNLVSLIGYCEEFENMALIYEFMFHGNVQRHLSAAQSPNVLSWSQRLQIAIDAAQGLEYLHNGCRPPIVHRDLKTSNILLNENMQAKIADFGLSKAFATEHDSHISTHVAGTFGYLDPEFYTSGNLSQKSDVYSFGVVLFELITGRPAIMRSPEGSSMNILHWVTPLIERGDIQSIVDPRLNGQFSINSAWKAVEIAMSCVPIMAVQRPDMNHVLSELKESLTAEIGSGRIESLEITSIDVDITPGAR